MKYMGSKSRIKKYIVPILNKIIEDNKINTYIEPFCGGCNIIDEIRCENKFANDKSEELIALLQAVVDGQELPKEVPKELYDDVRKNKDTNKYPKWYVGAIGYLASYNGRYFDGGYAKTLVSKTGVVRNYYDEAKRNLESQINNLKGIEFMSGDYRELDDLDSGILKGALIYCDPPYKGTKEYRDGKLAFSHDLFWKWVREQSKNNIVIVSEQQAPNDDICIWEQEVTRTQNNRDRIKVTEKLFTYNKLNK